ncbi:MAG: DUF1631 family protein [Caldimonas sp.]
MNPIDPRAQATLDAAMSLIRTAATAAATHVAENLTVLAQNATKISDRDQIIVTQQELRRNLGSFQNAFFEALREKVTKELQPRVDNKRKLESADWQSLSLVGEKEVEEQMNFVRLGQLISHECEWQLRDLSAYTGSLLNIGRADDERNPIRAEIIGASLHRGIEAISGERESRRLLTRELGPAVAHAMPKCYEDILKMFQERGVRPVNLTVRTVEGPGNQVGGADSGYQSLRDGRVSSRGGAYGEIDSVSGGDSEMDLLAAHRRALATAFPPGRAPAIDSMHDSEPAPRSAASRTRVNAAADQQLMTLLRRLTAIASQPGELDPPRMHLGASALPGRLVAAGGQRPLAGAASRYSGSVSGIEKSTLSSRGGIGAESSRGGSSLIDSAGGSGGGQYGEELTGLMAVNLIRAHREELVQASTGKLDHMVIDVVGSLFDQILSDSRVPPQMAREIARLQLPVLRVALSDATFFSTRRHPVRRFINRIASLANAFDEFDTGPGAKFLTRVRKLVDEIVEGDFDQIELYATKVTELERFIAEQNEGVIEQTGAATVLDAKESELRIQQRYMLQLQASLNALHLPEYLLTFLAQVWSQALVLAARRDGPDSDRSRRYRRVGTDIVMSIQPKGSPMFRKKFLMQLPPLMKDLNEGMRLIGWPEAAQKEFFGKLLPAHAESLKGQALSELDHNLMVKQLDALFSLPVPGSDAFASSSQVPDVEAEVIERHFTAAEAEQVGLVAESAINWSRHISRDGDHADRHREAGAAMTAASPNETVMTAAPQTETAMMAATPTQTADAGDGVVSTTVVASPSTDTGSAATLDPTTSESGEPAEPTDGPQLIDHVKLGFAYEMHLKDEWQKVRLAHVSSGRSFFVFTRGARHQETISMTARMLVRMCDTGRMRAVESVDLMERATQRARKQLAELHATAQH